MRLIAVIAVIAVVAFTVDLGVHDPWPVDRS